MARKTVRIDIPSRKPDELLTLLEAVKDEHLKLGADSPIDNVDMTSYATRVGQARQLRDQADALNRQAQALNERAERLMGIGKGQTSKTEGTLLYELLSVRDLLLVRNRGHENNLEPWGFTVVTGTAASPKPRTTPAK